MKKSTLFRLALAILVWFIALCFAMGIFGCSDERLSHPVEMVFFGGGDADVKIELPRVD